MRLLEQGLKLQSGAGGGDLGCVLTLLVAFPSHMISLWGSLCVSVRLATLRVALSEASVREKGCLFACPLQFLHGEIDALEVGLLSAPLRLCGRMVLVCACPFRNLHGEIGP